MFKLDSLKFFVTYHLEWGYLELFDQYLGVRCFLQVCWKNCWKCVMFFNKIVHKLLAWLVTENADIHNSLLAAENTMLTELHSFENFFI